MLEIELGTRRKDDFYIDGFAAGHKLDCALALPLIRCSPEYEEFLQEVYLTSKNVKKSDVKRAEI
jgi:hypothetical protein